MTKTYKEMMAEIDAALEHPQQLTMPQENWLFAQCRSLEKQLEVLLRAFAVKGLKGLQNTKIKFGPGLDMVMDPSVPPNTLVFVNEVGKTVATLIDFNMVDEDDVNARNAMHDEQSTGHPQE